MSLNRPIHATPPDRMLRDLCQLGLQLFILDLTLS